MAFPIPEKYFPILMNSKPAPFKDRVKLLFGDGLDLDHSGMMLISNDRKTDVTGNIWRHRSGA